ncbi:MAG: 5'-methylthioadenosine/adenosylhomocysteine nucleosidase [Oscillospiraceae bacterium]|nr:5'-methylthioadenosine/adenosylhomocysteine nucleosidase [Oscillospiraceae bacterium]
MKKLGIIGAMDVEIATLKEAMTEKQERRYAGMDFCEGVLQGMPVVVARCGVGKVHGALCVQVLRDLFQVTHVVNTGIAGSLSAQLDIGDLVISRDAMYHDFDCVGFGYPMGKVPGLPVTFAADEGMLALALEAAQQVHPGHVQAGRVASGDQFVCDRTKKEQIIAVTGGLCTEMEGAAIAQAAVVNELPFVIIRAISDKADDSAEMDYPSFERLAAQRCAAVTMALAAAMA